MADRRRRRIPTKERVAIFEASMGRCHMCNLAIHAGEAWDVSHKIPLELGGEDRGDNLKPAHRKCHRDHTAKVDQPNIARAKRKRAAHIGAKAAPERKIARARKEAAPPQQKASAPPPKGSKLADIGALPRRSMFR